MISSLNDKLFIAAFLFSSLWTFSWHFVMYVQIPLWLRWDVSYSSGPLIFYEITQHWRWYNLVQQRHYICSVLPNWLCFCMGLPPINDDIKSYLIMHCVSHGRNVSSNLPFRFFNCLIRLLFVIYSFVGICANSTKIYSLELTWRAFNSFAKSCSISCIVQADWLIDLHFRGNLHRTVIQVFKLQHWKL